MPRRPDTPCTGCGELLWSGTGSLPAERRYCRSCRKLNSIPYGRRDGTVGMPIACPICECEFLPSQARVKTCSRRCGQLLRSDSNPAALREASQKRRLQYWQAKNRRRRALKRGGLSEPYTLDEIAARDKYRCQLCRRKVDMTLAGRHPKAPSIDHVIPIVEGGNDVRANVQLAHFGCNSSKGAGGSQQLALVG